MFQRVMIVLGFCFIFASANAADFQGISTGNYLQYYPDIKVKYVEPVLYSFSIAEIAFKWVRIEFPDVKKFKDDAEKIAKDKGFQNYAISNFKVFDLSGSCFASADMLFW
jgi:hypothetical protein